MCSGSDVVGAATIPPGARIGQRLQRDERAINGVRPRTGNFALGGPVQPELFGGAELIERILRRGGRQMRRRISQGEWYGFSGIDGKFADGFEIFAAQRHCGGSQQHHIGSRDGSARSIVEPHHPRHRGSIAEPDHQFGSHGDTAALANDQAHDTGACLMSRHEVDERRGPFSILEARLQDQRVGPISPCYLGRAVLRGNQPAAMFRRAKERRETGVRIKPRPAQPINGAIATDQRGCLAVADDRVVFNR